MLDLSFMARTVTVEDPQGTTPVENAYAVLVEAHLNFQLQGLVGVFNVWRSEAAYRAGKQPMLTLPITLKPEETGKEFFARFGKDAAGESLGPKILEWCLSQMQNNERGIKSNPELSA